MKKLHTLFLCMAIIGSCTNITAMFGAMTDAGTADALAHLNKILNRKKISRNNTSTSREPVSIAVENLPESEFLQDLDTDIKCCKQGLPKLAASLKRQQKELSSYPEFRPYLNHLERYYNDVNNFNEKNKTVKDEYPMHSAIRKEAIRIQFYQERDRLGIDYKKLQEFGE